jgi:dihydroorotase
MFELVIHGGMVVTPEGVAQRDLAISNGVIREMPASTEPPAARTVIDASGKYILPGLVDAHVHIPGYMLSTRLDDFHSASIAAAVGGVTTVMLMPTDDPRTITSAYFERKQRIGERESFVDFAIQALIGPGTERCDIEAMAGQGAISFELFLAYGGNPGFIIGHDDYELHRLMQIVAEVGGIVGVTPHSASLIAKLTQLQKQLEATRQYREILEKEIALPKVQMFATTRPTLSEALGIARACTVAAETQTRIHLRALSSQRSIDIVERFRDSAPLSTEVMSHHLLFCEEEADELGPYGIIVPPIRSKPERDALRQAVRTGAIDMIVSDHSPVLREDKELGWASIWQTPPGMPGLQTLLPSMLALVDDGHLSLSDVVRACAEQPARAFGLYPRKGCLLPGADADLIILDPSRSTLIEDSAQRSKAQYTTLKGRLLKSRVEKVFLRGRLIVDEEVVLSGPSGKFVRAS